MDGAQGYDRYAYGSNNPVKYSDPSGHWPVPPPEINPFTFGTWFISVRGALKSIVGVEGDVTIYANMKPVLEKGVQGIKDTDVSVNVEGNFSVGLSEKLRVAAVVGSTESSPSDQSGVRLPILDGYSGTVAGCFHACLGSEPAYDPSLKQITKDVLVGWGEGVDISLNLVHVSDSVFSAGPQGVKVQFPILNKGFLEKVPFVGPFFKKALEQ